MTAALEGGEWSATRPGRTLPPRKDPVPILQGAGWAPGPVSTGGKYRPHRDSIPGPSSQSLYRLSYRAHTRPNTRYKYSHPRNQKQSNIQSITKRRVKTNQQIHTRSIQSRRMHQNRNRSSSSHRCRQPRRKRDLSTPSYRGADKSSARPGSKQATATKLRTYSTYSPQSSVHLIQGCSVCISLYIHTVIKHNNIYN